MTVSITDYYLNNVGDPTKVSTAGLNAAGYSYCKLPRDFDFRRAYVTAQNLVGSKNFLTMDANMFWFENAALAVQFRLLL